MIAIDEKIFKVAVYSWDEDEHEWGYYYRMNSFSEELQSSLDKANAEIDYNNGKRVEKLLKKYCNVEPTSEKIDVIWHDCYTVKVTLKE